MRERSAEGQGAACRKQTEIISSEEEEMLWKSEGLGEDSPRQLLDTILYLTGLNFALRGGKEHRSLRLFLQPQITGPHTDHNGRRFLLYSEDVSKTNPGGLKNRKQVPKQVRAYENLDNPKRCYLRLYQKYKSLCPTGKNVDYFYFTPREKPKDGIWYQEKPVGHNTLQTTIKRLCKGCGIQGNKTNHSLRATAATRLYQANVEEQMICEITGHTSEAVRSYKRTSDGQKSAMSDILATGSKRPKSETVTKSQLPSMEGSPEKLITTSSKDARQIVFNVNIT